MTKKKLFSDKPWPKGLPTDKTFVVADEKDFAEKEKPVACIQHFCRRGLYGNGMCASLFWKDVLAGMGGAWVQTFRSSFEAVLRVIE